MSRASEPMTSGRGGVRAARAVRAVIAAMAGALLLSMGAACDTSRKEPLVRQQPEPAASPARSSQQVTPAPAQAGPAAQEPAAPGEPDEPTDADLPVETDFEAAAEAEITEQTYKAVLSALSAEISADDE